jgi:transcriptional regulator with XRE-family HTH domain
MNTKIYSNETARAAALLASDPTVEAAVQREIAMSSMVTRLMSMRVAKGVTQEKVAAEMDCDPSKISRLEAGTDTSLKWNDILAYVRALDLEMTISFTDKNSDKFTAGQSSPNLNPDPINSAD